MLKATKEHKDLIVALLGQSFQQNQSVNYIIHQDSHRLTRIRYLMDYSFEICLLFGEVWLSDDYNACALVLYPHQKRMTLYAIWLDILLIFRAITLFGVLKTLKREAAIKQIQPKIDMAYLWFIGVEPDKQGLGNGTALLSEIIDNADNDGLPVYLETSTVKNLPWYKHNGFEIYEKLELSYTLFFLKREPDK
jgi:GNAT superfamily N-acetyltransferase